MNKQKFKKLNRVLAKNIVNYRSYQETNRTVCVIAIGDVDFFSSYAMEGTEEEVLEIMKIKFWSAKSTLESN